MDEKLRSFSIRFRTMDKITVSHQLKAKTLDEAIDLAKKLADEKSWRMVSIREFSAKKSEEQREPKYSLQALEKAKVIGFTNVDFDKETSKITDEEKKLYQAKTEAWNTYKSLCTKFYSDYSEDLEKQLQMARQKFDLALRNLNEFMRENYGKIDVCL
jgi:predicted  nucleic acid-binding Zn-ribbon protein